MRQDRHQPDCLRIAVAPFRVTGGTIKRVAIDLSGEPCIDREREVQGMLTREWGT